MNRADFENRIKQLELELSNLESGEIEARHTPDDRNTRFQTLANFVPAYIGYVNADTLRYEFVNDFYEQSLGIPREKIIGSHIKDVMGETNYQFAIKYIDEVKSGKSCAYENTFDMVSGKRWIQVNYSPVFDVSSKVIGIALVCYDITERKQNEKLLSIQNRISNIFLTVTGDDMFNEVLKVILEVTESPFGIFGYTDEYRACVIPTMKEQIPENGRITDRTIRIPKEIWGDYTWACALREKRTICYNEPSNDVPGCHVKTHRHISKPILFQRETIGLFQVADKETDYTAADLEILERISAHVAPILYSILQHNRTTEKLIENENALQKLNTDKDRFISILSHDLKSPFNSLLGFSELLKDNIRQYDIDKIENFATQINNTALKTFNLLEDILLWAETQQGKILFKPQELSFQDICQDAIEILYPNADAKNITIEVTTEDNIHVFADINMLKTVLRNLVSNAIKFTNNGGVIIINAESDSENIIISVSDTGIGILPENLTKLFDISGIFTTKGTADETGTGLGLLLCKEFVEKHGGKIWVVSETGIGSDFKFTLPVFNG